MSKPDAGAAAFALRCTVACLGAYALSLALGLAQPLWAAMGATMVSQLELGKTRTSASARVVSTAFGALVSLAAGSLGARFGLPVSAQMGVAVALTAGVAHRFPAMRPAIWTCPLSCSAARRPKRWPKSPGGAPARSGSARSSVGSSIGAPISCDRSIRGSSLRACS